ncbi:MAG: DUF2871 domain-containing protein [Solobacterium sp.]|jgi:hypothetical protein|nr:DUF2871 domain-containing protein [Solobacterium sp.]MCH4265094.1 DUF2871 domain-containing protein [Solobacterium sp.]
MKKKYLNLALYYAIAAMVFGVFYREFTKWNSYTGVTMLGKAHGHLMILGTFLFLIISIAAVKAPFEKEKNFSLFMKLYNIGLPLTAIMMAVRGITQVLNISLSTGMDAMISGIAGIGHILTGVGLVLLLLAMKKTAVD